MTSMAAGLCSGIHDLCNHYNDPESICALFARCLLNSIGQYLSARGDWAKSEMCLQMVKRTTVRMEELWTYLTRPDLIAHLKSEALADDLINRHVDAALLLGINVYSVGCIYTITKLRF